MLEILLREFVFSLHPSIENIEGACWELGDTNYYVWVVC